MEYQKMTPLFGKEKREYSGLKSYSNKSCYFKCQLKEAYEGQSLFVSSFKPEKRKNARSQFRVDKLLFPNPNGIFETAFSFDYKIYSPGLATGNTTVTHWDGAKTAYSISPQMLPINIQYFDKEENLRKEKKFEWDRNQWLKSIEVKDAQKVIFKKHFEYDEFGNPSVETFEGDLCGNGQVDTYTIKRTFLKMVFT